MSSWLARLRRKLAPFRQVQSAADVALVLHCGGFLTFLPFLLRLPLARQAALLEPRRVPPPPSPARIERITDLVTAVVQLQRLIPANCLPHGLARYYFLRRAGAPVELCYGAGREEHGEFIAHCWLLLEGEPYREPRDPREVYREFFRFPHATGAPTAASPKVVSP